MVGHGTWCAVIGLVWASSGAAGEIGFLEEFALSRDRGEALKQLIPGTEDYYYYHCLHYQNVGKLAEVDRLLPAWIERHQRTPRVLEIENRQALLKYPADPKGSLEFLRQRLDLRFDHERQILGERPKLPSRLDENLVRRETLLRAALERHPGTLEGLTGSALEWASELDLGIDRMRDLLSRLAWPDLPKLPELVVAELNDTKGRGFGSLPIHAMLLRQQLDRCMALKPDLRGNAEFVKVYLTKLRPNPDVDWRNDAAARGEYLERLWAFVSTLDPSHNSLRAHVLYHRLAHDRALGVFDKPRFMAYIALPRPAPYMLATYVNRADLRDRHADLAADFASLTLLPRVGDDEPLIRSFLEQFFLAEDDTKPYEAYLDDTYLKRRLAETKIVNGLGDPERWYSLLAPELHRALKDRVDIDFAPTNKTIFAAGEQVAIDVYVKNVVKLLVKVFEINALNYYRANQRELDVDIDLDGLVASVETTQTYADPPLLRIKRHLEFPSLARRGTYIIELIGNGMSSRALVRKGTLRFLVRTSVAGHVFTILDEANRLLPDAALYLAGQRYDPDKQGAITVPFTNQPGRRSIVLAHGDAATLEHFDHEAEEYALSAGFHVDREALLARRQASVIVRPLLMLNETPVTLSILEEPRLIVTSMDRDGIMTTQEAGGFKISEDRESVHSFQVPPYLATIAFTIKARVQNLSQGKKIDLESTRFFELNEIDGTDKTEQFVLTRAAQGYLLDLVGKTGEPKPDRPVGLTIKHRDFKEAARVTLGTDATGRIVLGRLADIDHVTARGPEGTEQAWILGDDEHTYPRAIHDRVGETIRIPYMGGAAEPLRSELSLLEVRGESLVEDRFAALSLRDGFIEIGGLPAGDYSLWMKRHNQRIAIRIAAGPIRAGHALSAHRQLELQNPAPLQITSVAVDKESVVVRLENDTERARVHVVAARFVPAYPIFSALAVPPADEPSARAGPSAETRYVAGRDIGDEYRYVLERRFATEFAGVMLSRPSLLLNPWAIRSTETGQQRAEAGDMFRSKDTFLSPESGFEVNPQTGGVILDTRETFPNLDFLGEQSVVLSNLKPDAQGVVTIKRADLGGHHQIHIVAVDPWNTAYRAVALPEAAAKFKDLRLLAGLDPKGHFTEQKQVTVVPAGGEIVLEDLTTSELQTYDSLDKVHALFSALSPNPALAEFSFILKWPKLTAEEKRAKYSEKACHELNFFLFRKDPAFFDDAVKPYLKNKYHKTFLDRWLVGEPLEEYLAPWAYGKLNVLERILLGRRIAAEKPNALRHVKDLLDLIPPDIARQNALFETALRGRALETAEADSKLGRARERSLEEALGDRKAGAVKALTLERLAETDDALVVAGVPVKPQAPPPPADGAATRPGRPILMSAAGAERARTTARGAELADMEELSTLALVRRGEVRQLFRALDTTMEWVENNYYRLPIEQQDADLVTVNGFWRDYAAHAGDGPFLSPHVAEASRNFTEMMAALAVLDLPFEAAEHAADARERRFSLRAATPLIAYHQEITPAQAPGETAKILLSQDFYRNGERFIQVGGEQVDKFVTDEFLVHTVYGCQVVVTNPTSSRQRLSVLLEIPRGAIPLAKGRRTRSVRVDLEPYRTWTTDYLFYFPAPGTFEHFPVHVARDERLVAFAQPFAFKVLERPSAIDRNSWEYVSQLGADDAAIAFLEANNAAAVNLERIAWRMRDPAFFRRAMGLFARRHVYEPTLWSYGLLHDDPASIREFLKHADGFIAQCGAAIASPILTVDPVERKSYEHLEYWPLVNARAHALGKKRAILNDRLFEQYGRFLRILSYRPSLGDDDLMEATYYLLLQDRIEEALAFFGRVKPQNLAAQLPYDYFDAYLGLATENLRRARSLAEAYAGHPIERWRNLFAAVRAQLDEIEGKAPAVIDREDRTQAQTTIAATEPSLDFEVEANQVRLTYQNLAACRVNYYLMDVELLFSRNPFVGEYAAQFSMIRPNETASIELDRAKSSHAFAVPERLVRKNILVEISGGGVTRAKPRFANALALQVIENYAQAKVTHAETGAPLPAVYVKVYARMRDGTVRFYKDGYTDLRGRFDYGSLSTNELENVARFSLLVLSDEHGALVREADPPQR